MLGPAWTSRMLQSMLLDLLTSETSIAEVAHARDEYTERQRVIAAALRVPLPDGINLWLPVRDERAAILHLAAAGIRVAAGSAFVGEPNGSCEVRVTSALVPVDEVATVASALVDSALP